MEPPPEQRIKQLDTELREQKHLVVQQLKDATDLIFLLRTMLQVVVDHGIALPKKSFRRPFPSWRMKKA